ncbi:MAG: hypothetical protein ACQEXQ_16155 [Bacillota bacterium]
MDRKTLDYMEERAKKAREIVNKIEGLLKEADRVDLIEDISCRDRHTNNLFALSSRHGGAHDRSRLIKAIRSAMKKMIAEEIALLEQELAEL